MKSDKNKITSLMETYGDIPKVDSSKAVAKQVKYSSTALLVTIVIIAVIVLINVALGILATKVNMRWDITDKKIFTLSEQTIEVIDELKEMGSKSEIIILGNEKTMREEVTTTNAISAYRYIVETVDNYNAASENIDVHYVEPRYNPSFFTSRGIDVTSTEEASPLMVIYSPETKRYRIVYDTAFSNLEYVGIERRITGALVYSSVSNMQTVAVIRGHGETEIGFFGTLLNDNGFDVKNITLSEWDEIPEEVGILVIVNPQSDYSIDDINKIDRFLSNDEQLGKHLFVFGDLDMPYNLRLETYLKDEWGLSFGTETIFDTQENVYTLTSVVNPFLKVTYADGDASKEVAGSLINSEARPYVGLGRTRPIIRDFDFRDEIDTYPLITSLNTSFGRNTTEEIITYEAFQNVKKTDSDSTGPFEILVGSRRVRSESSNLITSQVIVGGSISLINDYFLSNTDGFTSASPQYMLNLIKFLSEETKTIDSDVLPEKLIGSSLNFTNDYEVVFVFLGLAFGIPAVFAVVAIVVYRRRKHL